MSQTHTSNVCWSGRCFIRKYNAFNREDGWLPPIYGTLILIFKSHVFLLIMYTSLIYIFFICFHTYFLYLSFTYIAFTCYVLFLLCAYYLLFHSFPHFLWCALSTLVFSAFLRFYCINSLCTVLYLYMPLKRVTAHAVTETFGKNIFG